jgi:hypothetical protein
VKETTREKYCNIKAFSPENYWAEKEKIQMISPLDVSVLPLLLACV